MNELQSICKAAAAARAQEKAALLATVVRVRGSAYRRPGARMLLTEDGWQAGGISGGCLEGDILRRAWWRTRTGRAVVVAYDSTLADYGEDATVVDAGEELAQGYGLGCNGIVEVLLERLEDGDPACPVAFLDDCLRHRRSGVLATVIAVEDGKGEAAAGVAVGRRLLRQEGEAWAPVSPFGPHEFAAQVERDALQALADGTSRTATYVLPGGARAAVFHEVVLPATPLVICGAGHDAVPLARMAKTMGWHVTVVDPRPGVPPRPDHFPGADAVVSCDPAELPARIALDRRTAAVVMSHNVFLDAALLAALLPSPVRYIGVLGPRHRTERLLESLHQGGTPLPGRERLHGPVGLDIGAEDPETIALSILAEMQAVLASRRGGFLRDRGEPIHPPAAGSAPILPQRSAEPAACTLTTAASAW